MDFIHFISREDELNGLGMALGLGFVMSEEELLLGQVSWASLGLSNASCVASPRKGRSSDGPGFGVANYFWAGPHNSNVLNMHIVTFIFIFILLHFAAMKLVHP